MCPDPALLSAYFDGETSQAEADRINAHLDSCPACRATLELFSQRRDVLRADGPTGLDDDGRLDMFWTYVGQNRIQKVSSPRRVSIPIPLAAAAALAFTLAVVMNFINLGGNDAPDIYLVEAPAPVPTVVSLTITPGELDDFFTMLEGGAVDGDGLVVLPNELPVSLFGEPQLVRPASLEGGN